MVFIAAEIGVNFRDIKEASKMIGLARYAGADGVKFQVFREQNIKGHPREEELLDISLELPFLKELKKIADGCCIEFFATPMYLEAVDMLEEIGVTWYKIRYADKDNESLITKVLNTGKEVLLSCDIKYITRLENDHEPRFLWLSFKKPHFIYCIPEYPPETVDLPKNFLVTHQSIWYGYSNHYPSIIAPLVAAARGAEYIEVHVKQDRYHKGYRPIDDAVSITFSNLKILVRLIREMERVIS